MVEKLHLNNVDEKSYQTKTCHYWVFNNVPIYKVSTIFGKKEKPFIHFTIMRDLRIVATIFWYPRAQLYYVRRAYSPQMELCILLYFTRINCIN